MPKDSKPQLANNAHFFFQRRIATLSNQLRDYCRDNAGKCNDFVPKCKTTFFTNSQNLLIVIDINVKLFNSYWELTFR
jgi:hypothetical protein